MAAIQDVAGIFVGSTLELFNEAERFVQRDGDVAGAQAAMRAALLQVCHTKQTGTAGSNGSSTTKRT